MSYKARKERRRRLKFDVYDKLDNCQMFGLVDQINGNHFIINCSDGIYRFAPLTNKIRKCERLAKGDIVTVSLRDYENGKCDIIGLGRPPPSILEILRKESSEGNNYNVMFEFDSDDELKSYFCKKIVTFAIDDEMLIDDDNDQDHNHSLEYQETEDASNDKMSVDL